MVMPTFKKLLLIFTFAFETRFNTIFPLMSRFQKLAFLLLAAGSGRRMKGTVRDKILHSYKGASPLKLLGHTLCQLAQKPDIVIVYKDLRQQKALAAEWAEILPVRWVQGGEERRDSVWAALQSLPTDTEIVAIHDAARPLVKSEQIDILFEKAGYHGAAVLAHRVKDSIKKVSPRNTIEEPVHLESLPREALWAMETPQVFAFREIFQAYRQSIANNQPITDDLGAWEATGKTCFLLENPYPNPKITTPSDIAWLEILTK